MPDQANDLRKLVQHYAVPARPQPAARPGLLVVAGGKGGVGTTTIAVNLAVALGQRGTRTLLIDAAPSGDVATLCRIEPRHTLAEVLAGRRSVEETIQPGPEKIRVLPGAWGAEGLADFTAAAMDRILAQLPALAASIDMVVLDAGNFPGPVAQRCWLAADALLLVAIPQTTAVVDTYASIKLLAQRQRTDEIHLLVNMARDAETAADVYRRLAKVCRRFLAVQLEDAGHVPSDARVAAAAFAAAAPGCAASRQIGRLAQLLTAAIENTRHKRSSVVEEHEALRMTA
jgi:flagellar biosynthesis protein FlhG